MSKSSQESFQADGAVGTEKSDSNTECIPPGIMIVHAQKNGDTLSYKKGDIGVMKRSLLVFASNLGILKKHMANNHKK